MAQVYTSENQATFTLGPAATSPLQLTSAYATVANDGSYCPPAPVTSIKGPDGKDVDFKRSPCRPVLNPQVARYALQVLDADTHQGTSAPQFQNLYSADPGLSIAGKTGTVNATDVHGRQVTKNAGLWFVGVTPNLAATTAMFNITNSRKPISGLAGMTDDQAGHLDGEFAARVWANALTQPLQGQQWTWPDPNAIPNGVPVPNIVNQPYDQARKALTQNGFKVVRSPVDCGSATNYGAVAFQSPSNVAAAGLDDHRVRQQWHGPVLAAATAEAQAAEEDPAWALGSGAAEPYPWRAGSRRRPDQPTTALTFGGCMPVPAGASVRCSVGGEPRR